MAAKLIRGLYDGVKTSEIDDLAAETAAYMNLVHPAYGQLAARLVISNLHKNTSSSWLEVVKQMYNYVNPKTEMKSPILADDVYQIIVDNIEELEAAMDYQKDYTYDFFAFKTLDRSYLTKIDGAIVERPQMMLMRVSVGIHKNDIASAIKTYNYMSEKWFTHATPTLFNSGTTHPQMSSCFLLTMKDDSIDGIYETLKNSALISKTAGGIGISVHPIRAAKSYIRGTNGTSNGLVPMLRVFNDTARYVDQGGGKRKGAFAVYLEPWHADIEEFLDLKKNTGREEHRARDLFYGLWIPDLFMRRVEANEDWSLFCPNECHGLFDAYGEKFDRLYSKYEKAGKARKTYKARELWFKIVESQIETGTPYMMYKDACNKKSNQKNLGTIRSSNLCTEIVEYTSPDEVAVCNLGSIALSKFVQDGIFNFDKLYEISYHLTGNLNLVIDETYYPIKEAEYSNLRHRPIGLGVQGLADAFILMGLPFDSEDARQLNKDIFETIYFAALTRSNDEAKVHGHYETFPGSPASDGILQFDFWDVDPSDRWDWDDLRDKIMDYGLRNSLLLAPMPTASTSQILGNNECIEPYTSNIYTRKVLSGEFTVINKHLINSLLDMNLWNEEIRNQIIAHRGSVQRIPEIPDEMKEIYRTVWEIPQRSLIDMAADRGAYIDQSQSLNVFLPKPTVANVTSMHFYGWKKGLKTGMYYLRTLPAADAIQFTVDKVALKAREETPNQSSPLKRKAREESPPRMSYVAKRMWGQSASLWDDDEGCLMCSG
eukprot:TRINITY_DN11206_c0_g1_i1.p1 TRINITY_DN11206_c0_g1~~TRINITY_DN11206_c0_g1_i1.p1  ORF type:complete len:817 (-),score=199.70 TRINITY_DN11206_c0_g1_i1:78-2387(-)